MSVMDTEPLREFKDIRIEVPWGHVVGRWYGNRKVRPILAIHGWLDNMGTWDTLIPLLPTHIGILCVDLPGHGKSSKYPKGMIYHVIDYVHIIIRIMKEYNWQKVSLMGHSMGSIICFLYAAMLPRTVDLLIGIDIIKPVYRSLDLELKRFAFNVEKTLVEDERLDNLALQEPPSYTYAHAERVMYEGSRQSVDLENCKYILNRSITKSALYPDKYFFSRDGKVKYYVEFNSSPALTEELTKRIRNVAYFVVKGSRSNYINESSNEIIRILRENNPHFEMHEIEGTHHVHLNNAKDVAAVLGPYIQRHRPATLDAWTMNEEQEKSDSETQQRRRLDVQKYQRKLKYSAKSKL